MIPKAIHQIYFNLQDKELHEIDIFSESHEVCKNQDGYDYKLWNEDDVEKLIYDKWNFAYDLYKSFPYDIQRIDFARYCILGSHGGLYVDLDNIILKPLDDLLDRNYLFHTTRDNNFVSLDFLGSQINKDPCIFKAIVQYCMHNYKEKCDMDIYKTWKGRFVLQTTGPRFLGRFLRDKFPKYRPLRNIVHSVVEEEKKLSTDRFYMKDHRAGSWLPLLKK